MKVINYLPMTEAPEKIAGSFNVEETLYSVSKKGELKKLKHAPDCTFAGDEKVSHIVDKTIPRIAIETTRYGNGGYSSICYYKN